jgi:hypothetical protein
VLELGDWTAVEWKDETYVCMRKLANHQQKGTSVMNMGTLELSIVEVQHTWGTLTDVPVAVQSVDLISCGQKSFYLVYLN